MYALTDERIPLVEIFQTEDNFENRLKRAFTHEEKLSLTFEFLNLLANRKQFGLEQLIYASNEIWESKGQIDIAELIQPCYMSRRKFERKFLEEVGVSPKAYAKIRRFSYICSIIAGKKKTKLKDVLFEGGYYDQSHFIKDFKYFAGRSPKLYMQTNT